MIVVIPCGASKKSVPAPAMYLYEGTYFRNNLQWALSVTTEDKIFILSAKYGLVPTKQVLEPYDLFMGDPGSVQPNVVEKQIKNLSLENETVYALGGKNYLSLLRAAGCGLSIIAPVEGLPMGKQMAALKNNRGRLVIR